MPSPAEKVAAERLTDEEDTLSANDKMKHSLGYYYIYKALFTEGKLVQTVISSSVLLASSQSTFPAGEG